MQLTSIQKLVAQKLIFINLVKITQDNGDKEYFYLAVRGEEMLRLHQALKNANDYGFEPSDYGLILEGGRGEPSPEVKSRMEKEYGYNHLKSVPIIIDDNQAA